ncbi:MAG TPA: thioredoxin [Verrucomicrobiota bacterium]|nr:thioredoxin [Verrucomicrobiota bacterium]HNU50039.1 thioredoxin [Verrucomicrobiota bacterium]
MDESNFDAEVQKGVVLVDFWATWCGPCRTQGPIVEQVASRVEGKAKVAKLDVDKAPNIAKRFAVSAIPTLIVFKDGKPTKQFVGLTKADVLISGINAALD